MVTGDHPENDLFDFCDQDQIKQYKTIVGQLICLSGVGRFDFSVHVMTMSRFMQQPRVGHLERLKRIIGDLADLSHGSGPMSKIIQIYDWQRAVYSGAKEDISHDIPNQRENM